MPSDPAQEWYWADDELIQQLDISRMSGRAPFDVTKMVKREDFPWPVKIKRAKKDEVVRYWRAGDVKQWIQGHCVYGMKESMCMELRAEHDPYELGMCERHHRQALRILGLPKVEVGA